MVAVEAMVEAVYTTVMSSRTVSYCVLLLVLLQVENIFFQTHYVTLKIPNHNTSTPECQKSISMRLHGPQAKQEICPLEFSDNENDCTWWWHLKASRKTVV